MKCAAVLCSGPSLRDAWSTADWGGYDVVLAVNVAATVFACDWWVAGDAEAFDLFAPIAPPRCGVVTDALSYGRRAWWPRSGGQCVRWSDWRAPFGTGQWQTSGPTAVGFAAMRLGCARVHCFGMDLAGRHDLDGAPACTSDERWRVELRELEAIAAATGAAITRVLPTGRVPVVVPPAPPPPSGPRCRSCGRQPMDATGPTWRCRRCGWRSA